MNPSESEENKVVGIIGAGSFGIAVANLLAENTDVLMYARRPEQRAAIDAKTGDFAALDTRVSSVGDYKTLLERCQLVFPIIPSKAFRTVMQDLAAHITPAHFLIHGTKGLDLSLAPQDGPLLPEHIMTMSQVIEDETVCCRIGCLSGPNLSAEIMEGQPAATLIASRYTEVIRAGQEVLGSKRFQAFGSYDIIGAELTGALKNIIALAAGMLSGKGYGKNMWSLLVTRGLSEMIHIGKAVGANVKPFLGVAGIGDLIATASSEQSRNFKAGWRLAQGEDLEAIIASTKDVVEGVRTLQTVKALIDHLNVKTPVIEVIYRVVFKGMSMETAVQLLMTYPYAVDVDFI